MLLDEVGVVPLPETSGVELAFRDAVVVTMMVVVERANGVDRNVLLYCDGDVVDGPGVGLVCDACIQSPTSTSQKQLDAGM